MTFLPRKFQPLFLLLLSFAASPGVQAVMPGDSAPEVVGKTINDGRTFKLSDLRGKVVYLDFWATWCAPCRLSLPRLNQMRTELAAKGFEVVGVNVDEQAETAQKLLSALTVTYPMIRGVDQKLLDQYGILKMPASFVIDRTGVVRFVYQGFSIAGFAEVRPQVESIIETGKIK